MDSWEVVSRSEQQIRRASKNDRQERRKKGDEKNKRVSRLNDKSDEWKDV